MVKKFILFLIPVLFLFMSGCYSDNVDHSDKYVDTVSIIKIGWANGNLYKMTDKTNGVICYIIIVGGNAISCLR